MTKPEMVKTASTSQSLAQLRWRCRRGMLELDIFLNTFVEKQYAQLDSEQIAVFESMLDYPDQTLYELLIGKMQTVDTEVAELVSRIRKTVID